MNTVVQGVTFEKDTTGIDRYIRIDVLQHAEALRPFMQKLGIIPPFEDWEQGLTSEQFLKEAKQMLRNKFDHQNG
jgi:hypothetical protein